MKERYQFVSTLKVKKEGSLLSFSALALRKGESRAIVLLQDKIVVVTLNKETKEWFIVPDSNEVLLDLCSLVLD